MTEEEKTSRREEEIDFLPVIDGELIDAEPLAPVDGDEEQTIVSAKSSGIGNRESGIEKSKIENRKIENRKAEIQNPKSKIQNQRVYLLVPFLFLTVALLGGLRLGSSDGAFIFWRPALFCLISAAILMVLFFRAGLVRLEGWFSEEFTTLKNTANGAVLLTLFAASAQIFNALLPEQGLPFWVFAFCFFWTLWNNLFADFEVKKLLRSLGALFGLAFVVKYLILANLAAPTAESWWQGILQNPGKEAFTYLFDLPRFSAGTGYIQFFTVVFYLIGLFLLPAESSRK